MVGERLKYLLNILGISQEKFANDIGIKQGTVSDIIRGKTKNISLPIARLCNFLYGVNPTWLLTGEGDMFLPGREPKNGQNPPKVADGLEIIEGEAVQHPELDHLTKVAHTGWWDKLTETEREIVVFMEHLKDQQTKKQVRDLLEACLKKETTEEELLKKLGDIEDPDIKQKGAAG